MINLKTIILASLLCPIVCFSTESFESKEGMIRDLEIIQSTFEVKYAPKDWKNSYLGWDLQTAIDSAKEQVLAEDAPTVRDYQKIVKKFFNSMQDYHVQVSFSNTEMALLPFAVRGVNNRYFVSAVDEDFTLFQVGDEIISMDGVSVSELVEELMDREYGPKKTLSDRSLAENSLTMRLGTTGATIPQGDTLIKVKNKLNGQVDDISISWTYYPEMIKALPFSGKDYRPKETKLDKNLLNHPIFHKKWKAACYDVMKKAKRLVNLQNGNYFKNKKEWSHEFIGYMTSRIPRLGKVKWELQDSDFYDAYIYETPSKQRVGFIRIPTFDPEDTEEAAYEFAAIMNFFETHTNCLVIDQLDNPGGDMLYMYSLLSMLSKTPMKVFSDRETITQQDVMSALELSQLFNVLIIAADEIDINDIMGDTYSGYAIDLDLLKGFRDYFQFLINEWNEGRQLSNSHYIYGIDKIKPNKKYRFTKPILLLVNELDFSCGDMFPSILQDNKRAVLMGSPTAGAGGYVIPNEYYNWYGIAEYTITGSIAQRVNGQVIENLGIKPDIPYAITENDLQNGNVDFAAQINRIVETLLLK